MRRMEKIEIVKYLFLYWGEQYLSLHGNSHCCNNIMSLLQKKLRPTFHIFFLLHIEIFLRALLYD